MRVLSLLSALVGLAVLIPTTGCGGGTLVEAPASRPGQPPPIDASRLSADVRRFAAMPSDSSARARRAAIVSSALRSAGWMPAVYDRYALAAGPEDQHLWATLAGRDPSRYSEVVIVAVDLDASAPLAAALETARRLARQAAFDQVPERSVLLALFAPTRPGVEGLRHLAARPPWALDAVRHVLYVTADTVRADAVRAGAPPLGAPVDVIVAPTVRRTGTARFFTSASSLASASELAGSLYTALVDAAVPPPTPPDTLDS